jgi:hypothetical protein
MVTNQDRPIGLVDRADIPAIVAWTFVGWIPITILFLVSQLDYIRRIEVPISKFEDICFYTVPAGRGTVDRFSECDQVPEDRKRTSGPAGRVTLEVPLKGVILQRQVEMHVRRFNMMRANGSVEIAPLRFERERIRFATYADYRSSLDIGIIFMAAVPIVIVWVVRSARIDALRREKTKVNHVQA